MQPWYNLPVFGRIGDDMTIAYVRTNITWAARNVGAPPLTETEIEAVELVGSEAAEEGMWVERRFPAGTMWFANNQTMLHMPNRGAGLHDGLSRFGVAILERCDTF